MKWWFFGVFELHGLKIEKRPLFDNTKISEPRKERLFTTGPQSSDAPKLKPDSKHGRDNLNVTKVNDTVQEKVRRKVCRLNSCQSANIAFSLEGWARRREGRRQGVTLRRRAGPRQRLQ